MCVIILHIRLNKVDKLIEIYEGIRYLQLTTKYKNVYYRINSKTFNTIFDRINYLINEKVMINIVLIILSKFSTIKEIFRNRKNSPQYTKFSTIKENFGNQENFPQSRKFSSVKEIFHSEGNFLQSRKFSTKNIYLIKEVFHK